MLVKNKLPFKKIYSKNINCTKQFFTGINNIFEGKTRKCQIDHFLTKPFLK